MSRRQLDPYGDFRFRLKQSGRDVAGFMECAIAPSLNQAAGTSPGGLTLKRGISEDPRFSDWACAPAPGTGSGRQEIAGFQLEILNQAGVVVRRFELRGCRISEVIRGADPGATIQAFPIESIALKYDVLRPVD